MHLSGNMERFIWGVNSKKFSDARPIELKLGESAFRPHQRHHDGTSDSPAWFME
jgi:hypothetical protein